MAKLKRYDERMAEAAPAEVFDGASGVGCPNCAGEMLWRRPAQEHPELRGLRRARCGACGWRGWV